MYPYEFPDYKKKMGKIALPHPVIPPLVKRRQLYPT